jgi:hypothetical protein
MSDTNKITTGTDSNPDPITGEPGSHPIGTGVGAAGAGATGAAVGAAVGGPVGAVVGAAVGAVAGGLAGKGVAESIDPTVEDAYWRQNHATQSFAGAGDYDQYSSAYRTGYTGAARVGPDKDYSSVEDDLKADYERTKDKAAVAWEHGKEAARSAYERARQNIKNH